ncbi:DUF4349 domain-containing protein [Halalkalibacter sp. APA_J-10(15)]|uniref:DUF4349 domain-containing protein n=1 Tax=Halalkalibacter sp. APA_J-10(15) TaxID=2933805 RepID=UPI001FF38D86|nr:DUF4349 domain-containing protein [Halalkalibacter sp. APA_J-10(15)]MCK0471962.1 DUF4349 domain-containing protein [Halalkalibacter sp. APA_J-10(15)]
MKNVFLLLITSLFVTVAGCQSAGEELVAEDTLSIEYAVEQESSRSDSVEVESAPDVASGEGAAFAKERMISYQSYMSVDVESLMESMGHLQERATEYNGYVVESTFFESETNPYGTMAFRIPEESFVLFMEEVSEHAQKVNHHETIAQDVTEEYVDLESRLSSKQAVEERLLQFLEEAENTENLLAISQDLANTQEEIEQLTGRMQYLENQVSYSSVSIDLKEDTVRVGTIQGEEDLNTWEEAKKLFIDTVNFLITSVSAIIVWLIGLSPLFIPIIVIAFVISYRLRRMKKKKTTLD